MNPTNGKHDELLTLLEALCENRLSAGEADRLEKIVLEDEASRKTYLEYLDMHGTLHWDTAKGGPAATAVREMPVISRQDSPRSRPSRRSWKKTAGVALAAGILLAGGIAIQKNFFAVEQKQNSEITESKGNSADSNVRDRDQIEPVPIELNSIARNDKDSSVTAESSPQPTQNQTTTGQETVAELLSSEAMVSFIDERIREAWNLEGIEASAIADDGEWIRRVYLDIVGHIPSADQVEAFLKDENPRKRELLIDDLLEDPDYVRNWTTVWTNLLVGRSSSRDVDRPALQKFLRDGFAQNRPWNEMVFDLVAAEGAADENGAANFLLAHLNNQAVPATAIVSRLFLGVQVQCTQCHDHPFNDWEQNQFWEFNSFFKQTARVRQNRMDEQTGQMVSRTELVSRPVGGETYYENRRGVMQVAYPHYEGVPISPDAGTNRRRELARLMTAGNNSQVARAVVNRMWSHFFGYGFTRPIDDMGPHNTPTHPELLELLAGQFVAGDFDLKQLIRWICNSRAYQLTSRFNDTNQYDDPDRGNPPLFSRMYVKPMTAEQLYDSLLVATRAETVDESDWAGVSRKRQQWLQQFIIAFDTEENDETTTFDGTIPQALLMMNSRLVQEAVGNNRGTYFNEVIQKSRQSETQAIRRLCLSALSRYPTDRELDAVRGLIRERLSRSRNRPAARAEALQDVFWAYLNSNEFILIH